MADRIVLLHHGEIQQIGSPDEIYGTPANTFVARFVGSPPMNLSEGSVESGADGLLFRGSLEVSVGRVGASGPTEGPATLGIRPEHLEIVEASHPEAVPAKVDLIERVGSDSNVFLIVGGETSFIASVDAATPLREGDEIHVRLPREHIELFQADGRRVDRGEPGR